jgi:hypothetical protein
VRVRGADEIEQLLKDSSETRRFFWLPQQWSACGQVFRVQNEVRQILADNGTLRPISGTVILDGFSCTSVAEVEGCGRACPLFFRDEWLEPADGPQTWVQPREVRAYATVRPRREIRKTLDLLGRRDGLKFMPEMYQYAGQRYPILKRISGVRELQKYRFARGPIFILEGLYCTGAAFAKRGGCDRGCTLLWHSDWLIL